MTAHWSHERRLAGLWRFAIAISTLNVFGHVFLGFEQAWIVPFVALAAAYGTELLLESVAAWSTGRPNRAAAGPRAAVEFLLSAHISGLAVGMLLYTHERLWVVAFASALAVASKTLVRVQVAPAPVAGAAAPTRHVFNPSNLGITATLLLFPWVGPAPPYQFVENVAGAWDWVLPGVVICTGSLLNTKLTGRMPLAIAWAGGFVAQSAIRAAANGTPLMASLAPMTGFGFVLYTFYMVTDPGTTPERPRAQVAFGAAVALVYALLLQAHLVFGIYYALTIVSGARGLWLAYCARVSARERARESGGAPLPVAGTP